MLIEMRSYSQSARLLMWAGTAFVYVLSTPCHAELRQVSYSENVTPTVQISVPSSVVGLAVLDTSPGHSPPTRLWARLPDKFAGEVRVEITTNDHRFQAAAVFVGDSSAGWERLEIVPARADGKQPQLSTLNLDDDKVAIRVWISSKDNKNERRFVLARWGGDGGAIGAGQWLRVQLNLGNAPEAALWLKSKQGDAKPAVCKPLAEASHVAFRWVCKYQIGDEFARKEPADLIVIRRDPSGRQSQETIRLAW